MLDRRRFAVAMMAAVGGSLIAGFSDGVTTEPIGGVGLTTQAIRVARAA